MDFSSICSIYRAPVTNLSANVVKIQRSSTCDQNRLAIKTSRREQVRKYRKTVLSREKKQNSRHGLASNRRRPVRECACLSTKPPAILEVLCV